MRKSRIEKREKIVKKKKKLFFGVSIPMFILIFILLGISMFGVDQIVMPTIKSNNPLSILLVGSDINEYREITKEGTKPEKTDSLMVVTFNPNTFRFVTTSIPRDTAIDYTCGEIRGKVNELYEATGKDIDCLVDSVSNFLNIPINYYIKVNMDQIKEILEMVAPLSITAYAPDGILVQDNVELTQTYTWYNGETYDMTADEALTYARARHDSSADYGRGYRQQQVIIAIGSTLLANGINLEVIREIFDTVNTDMELLLMKIYYEYINDLSNTITAVESGEYLQSEDFDSSVWENMYEYFEYTGEKDPIVFQDYLVNNFQVNYIKEYFFESFQFYNEGYNGFYVTPEDQRYTISNALRANLNLEEETPSEQVNEFGTNDFGCEISSKNDCSGY